MHRDRVERLRRRAGVDHVVAAVGHDDERVVLAVGAVGVEQLNVDARRSYVDRVLLGVDLVGVITRGPQQRDLVHRSIARAASIVRQRRADHPLDRPQEGNHPRIGQCSRSLDADVARGDRVQLVRIVNQVQQGIFNLLRRGVVGQQGCIQALEREIELAGVTVMIKRLHFLNATAVGQGREL